MGGAKGKVRNRLYLALGLFAAVIATSTIGYVGFGWTFSDAIYMTIITLYGVGFGEVNPIDTVGERIFTMAMIVGGTAAVVYVIGEVVRTVTEGEIQRAMGDRHQHKLVEKIHHHTIICGFGRIGQILAKDLAHAHSPFVIVDADEGRVAEAATLGYLVIRGSASEEDTLVEAGIHRATVLATVLPTDAINVYITLTARNLNPAIRIIARGEQPSTEKKLLQAGANEVVLPAAIGALRIAHSITKPTVAEFLGDAKDLSGLDLRHLGVEIHEISLVHHGHLEGTPLSDVVRMSKGDLMLLAIKREDGRLVQSGFDGLTFEPGDSLIVMGRAAGLPEFLKGEVTEVERA